jgi:hypothetical protein
MQIKVETATIKLLDKMLAIERQSFGKEAFTRQHIVYLMTDYNAIALTARVNDEIEGFVIARIDKPASGTYTHVRRHLAPPKGMRRITPNRALLKQKGRNAV